MSDLPRRTPTQYERREIIADASAGFGPDWYGPLPDADCPQPAPDSTPDSQR
jgi:hypothetical protein